jgi:hypothetical protein
MDSTCAGHIGTDEALPCPNEPTQERDTGDLIVSLCDEHAREYDQDVLAEVLEAATVDEE